MESLQRYRWTGNVRELQSVLKQAILQAAGNVVVLNCIPSLVLTGAGTCGSRSACSTIRSCEPTDTGCRTSSYEYPEAPGARTSGPTMPHSIAPMLAVSSATLPKGPGKWAFEFKWDAVRAICFWDGRSLRLQSHNKLDITRRYPELHGFGRALPRSGIVLDGEIIALDSDCRPSFNLLQYRMHAEGAATIARLSTTIPVWYVVFDVLWFRGKSVMDLPFTDRRRILENLKLEGPALGRVSEAKRP